MRLADFDKLITPERIRVYSWLLIAGYLFGAIWWLWFLHNGLDPLGKPIGYDFITFYAASDLARQGQAALAYDLGSIVEAEHAAIASDTIFLWHYPPAFQVLVAPLAFMPYLVALAAWVTGTFALYLLLIRRISSHPWALLVGGAFAPVFLNAMHGQNGFLNTALLGFGLLWLDKRPWLAGVLLGLLVYKPHFGVLLPLLLLVQGRWKSIAGAAISSIGLCAISYLAYGPQPWLAFIDNLSVISTVLETRELPWSKIPSVFVAVADLGAPLPLACAVHFAVALSMAMMAAWAWSRPGPQPLKVALAIPAILAVSPYCFDYDLVLMAIPIGIVGDHALRNLTPAGTRATLTLAFLAPIFFIPLAKATSLHIMPLALLALFACTWRVLSLARSPIAQEKPGRPAALLAEGV